MQWILGLFFIVMTILFLGPLFGILGQSNWVVFVERISAHSVQKSLWITLGSAAISSLVSVLLAIYFARWFALKDWKLKRIQRLLVLLPYLIPNFIIAISYVIAWNPTTGLLNWLIKFPFGLYGFWGMVFLFAITHMPLAFLILEEKFRKIDPAWREAARLSGANSRSILLQIEFPILMPSLLSSFSLCFALCISSFAIPAWIGAPKYMYHMTYKIYQALQLGGVEGIPEAGSLSILLLVLTCAPMVLNHFAQKKEKKLILVSGKSSKQGYEERKPQSFFIFQCVFIIYNTMAWIAPVTVLTLSTFVKPGCLQDQGLSCLKDFNFGTYKYALFELDETKEAFIGSFIYGGAAALIILFVCLLSLILMNRMKNQKRILEWIYSLPLATPGIILALGLIVVGSGRFGINVYNTAWILIAAYVIKHFNLAYQPLRSALTGVSSSLIEAAQLSGANTVSIWKRIIIPILKPEILGGFFLVFLPILSELTMSVMLIGPGTKNLGSLIFQLQDYADQASAAVLSIILVLVILLVNELTRVLSKGKLGY
ncbi:MAG: ABC transporter permease [Pseudobdellovibrionaceae bacterium]